MCKTSYEGSGYQCHPLRVKITYPEGITITCEAYHVYHTGVGPTVSVKNLTNCTQIQKESKNEGGTITDKYAFGMNIPSEDGCSGASSQECTVEFRVTHPMRGFHNQGSGSDSAPFTNYDSSNPVCTVSAEATWGDETDSDSLTLGETVNPTPDNHLPVPDETFTLKITAGGDDGIEVEFEQD